LMMQEQSHRILMISAEVAPLAKVGGLADVAGALPKALHALGHDARILMPAYPMVEADTRWQIEPLTQFEVAIRPDWTETATVSQLTLPSGVRVYLLRVGDWFANATESTKLYAVDPRAYVAFCRADGGVADAPYRLDAAGGSLQRLAHRAGSSLPAHATAPERTDAMATVFTIHNLAYQGVFEKEFFRELGLPDYLFDIEGLEFYGKVNLMKGALLYSDRVNTVSPTYAAEIQTPEYGERLEGLLRRLADERRLSGILNGIDYDEWNPETDPHIPAHYSATNLQGKAICKAELQRACGWQPDPSKAVIGLVSRLTDQKGLDLIKSLGAKLLQLPIQFVLLGTGDPAYERYFRSWHKRHRAIVHATIGFDNAWAHRIYAGADMFLMPSRFEPCGLGQMISLRYGTIPIVRQTGGLADSIAPYDAARGAGNGFVFREYKPNALYEAVRQAVRGVPRRRRLAGVGRARDAAGLVVEPLGGRVCRALRRSVRVARDVCDRLFALSVAVQARPRPLEERMRTHELDGRAPHHGRAGLYDCADPGHRNGCGAAALHPARANRRHGRLDCGRALGSRDESVDARRYAPRTRNDRPIQRAACRNAQRRLVRKGGAGSVIETGEPWLDELVSHQRREVLAIMMDAFQIQEAWKQFKVYGDPQAREQLIRQYAHLVKLTVARVVPYPPNGMEWEDLYSYGVMGLIRAVDMFDPTRNVKFETYAIALIRGAVLEALRSEDWVPRSARDKLRQLERVWVRLEASLGRPPTDEEAAEALGVSVHDYRQLLIDYARTNTVSLEACLINGDDEENNNLLETIADAEDPYEELLEREQTRALTHAIENLAERERQVIQLYYYEGLTFKEIGQVMNISESRVYQIHTRALARLREQLCGSVVDPDAHE
jgi:starch synthase